MNLNHWMQQARTHWAEHQPSRYRALKASGQLDKALAQAAKQTARELSALEAQGLSPHEAWEMTRERYLFPPPENPADEAPASPAAGLFGETQQILSGASRETQ